MPDHQLAISDVRLALDCANLLGEGPVWVAPEQALYWVDILAPEIWRMDVGPGTVDHWVPPCRISALAPRQRGGFVAAGEAGLVLLTPSGHQYDVAAHPEQGIAGNRFNDGGVDLHGQFWVGSMDAAERRPSGHIYRLAGDHSWQMLDSNYRVPNGPAFSPDGQAAYLADSARGLVYRYALEPDGAIIARRLFLQIPADQGVPDGMATDANGCVWIAFWDGGCVRCYNPDGKVLRQIDLPVPRPTSCAFGGADLDQLFITSARTGLSAAQLAAAPMAGALFVVTPGVHGWALPEFSG